MAIFRTSTLFHLSFTVLSFAISSRAYVNYANDFIDPNYVLSKNFSATTIPAQQTILSWAEQSIVGGPWSVTTKPYLAPSGDKHDYMSWAPYSWPDCSNVGNTTELTPQQVWTECKYVTRDGQFNPDARLVNNVGDFDSLANAVLYNSLAWALNGSEIYPQRVAQFINAWFLDPDTFMNPNLNYAQMPRGVDGQNGSHTGVLDLKCMAKIASGVLVLRQGQAPGWTTDIDNGFQAWIKQYITWLTTAELAIQEREAANNHGSFYFNQLAALQLLVNDQDGALSTIKDYFNGIYMNQIAANGDQPLESVRTRPYHYRAYNLAAMLTNGRIGQHVGFDAWNHTTKAGVTIQAAADYAMQQPAGDETASELYPDVAAVAAIYGDPGNKYANWLSSAENSTYVSDASFFWDQPLSDNGFAASLTASPSATGAGAANTGTSTVGTKQNGAVGMRVWLSGPEWTRWLLFYGASSFVLAASLVEFI